MPEKLPEKLRLAWEKQKQYYRCLEDFLDETVRDYLRRYDRRLVSKDLALFLRRYVMEHPPLDAAGRVDFSFQFRDNGSVYRVLVFSWVTDLETEPYVMVYRLRVPEIRPEL